MDGGLRRHHVLVFAVAFAAWLGQSAKPPARSVLWAVVAAAASPLAVRADALRAAYLHRNAEPTVVLATLRRYVVRLRLPLTVAYAAVWAVPVHARHDRWWATILAGAAAGASMAYAARPLGPPGAPTTTRRRADGVSRVDAFVAAVGPLWLFVAATVLMNAGSGTGAGTRADQVWRLVATLAGTVAFILVLRALALSNGRARERWPATFVTVVRVLLTAGAAAVTWNLVRPERGAAAGAVVAAAAAVTMALVVRPFPNALDERV